MLNIKVDHQIGETMIEARGNPLDMASEWLYVAAHIFKTLKRRDEVSAEGFKMLIQAAAEDEEGPVWTGDTGGEGVEICFVVPKKEES